MTGRAAWARPRLVLGLLADAAEPLDLPPLHDGTDLQAALATSLGVRPNGVRPLVEIVLDELGEQRLLGCPRQLRAGPEAEAGALSGCRLPPSPAR